MPPQPFRIHQSQVSREQLLAALEEAANYGLAAEAAEAGRALERGLMSNADALGESRMPLHMLGELRCETILPLTVWFSVHAGRREVFVSRWKFVKPGRRGTSP